MLLYERFLGRPFASHRDAVSELVGEVVEIAIKEVLTEAKVTFRETKRAERIAGFDLAPDFMIPDEFAPVALIARAPRYSSPSSRPFCGRQAFGNRLRSCNGSEAGSTTGCDLPPALTEANCRGDRNRVPMARR